MKLNKRQQQLVLVNEIIEKCENRDIAYDVISNLELKWGRPVVVTKNISEIKKYTNEEGNIYRCIYHV